MTKRRVLWIVLTLVIVVVACRINPWTTPEPTTPRPSTPTDEPTETPMPPRPAIPYTPVPKDTLSPKVIQRNPERGEALSPQASIELVFDRPMDRQAVAGALTVERAGTRDKVSGDVTWVDDRTVRYQPTNALSRDEIFDVILTQNATASTGEPLREPYTFRFQTEGYLRVAQVIPAPSTDNVETNTTLTVIFNRPVVPLTALEEMADFPDPLSLDPAVEGEGEWLNTSIYVFTPDAPLPGGITYRATVSDELTAVSGATLAEPYVWEFTTVPPKVLWVDPREGMELVDVDTAITVQFNQPVDADSARQVFQLQENGLMSRTVNGTFTVEDNVLTFKPRRRLGFDTVYKVSVDAGVTSTAGGRGMVEPVNWTFTTVPLPRIVSTEPKDDERNAPPHTHFAITFNAPIDPDTVMPNLTMTPPISPTQVHTYFSRYNNTFVLNFGARPSNSYEVVIRDGITDPYGNRIPQGRTVRFRTGPLPPGYRLRVPDRIGTYDAGQPAQLAISYLNLNVLDFRLFRLPIDTLANPYRDWDKEMPPGSDLIREWTERLEAPLNQQKHRMINLVEGGDGLLSPGIYLLKAEAPNLDKGDYRRRQYHILIVSDLNLTIKTAPEETMVWASDLATGEPVSNLSLQIAEIEGSFSERVTTDGEGIAHLQHAPHRRTLIAYSETPFAAASENWNRGISPWNFGMSGGVPAQAYRAHVYSDRPIYRPGQTVHFKGLVRAEDDAQYMLPDLQEVMVTVRDIQYEEIYSERLPLNPRGAFNGTLDLEEDARLGQYVIEVSFADQYAEAFFQVAAYRPPEFESVVTAAQSEIQRNDPLQATLSARYFFGGPLSDTTIDWAVLAEPYTFEPPWGGNYTFSDRDDPYRCFGCWWEPRISAREPILTGSGTTDAQGNLALSVEGDTLDEALTQGAKRLVIEARATGPDNQQIAGRTSVIAHPGPYYIGLASRTYVGQAGDENEIDLIAVDWQGERLSDRAIKVSFYHRTWTNTFIENEAGGGRWSWETEETLVEEVTVNTDNLGEVIASFVPPKGGSYHVVAEPANPTPETASIRASIFLWVAGEDYVSWRRENHDRITLVSDKNTYKVGETAEILIPSPFQGPHYALVSVERKGILRHEVLRLTNNSTIYRLPITEEAIPNIYVSVVLVKGRGEGLAEFKMGLLPLDVNLDPKTLTLDIEAPEQAEPGEEVTYTVTVRDPNGEPVSGTGLSLDIVDKAILSLKPRTQTILDQLYARRSLQVTTASGLVISVNRYQEELADDLDLEEEVVEETMAMEGGMADAEMPAEAGAPMPTMVAEKEMAASAAPQGPSVDVREEFADTAYWAPSLVTDARGQVQVTVTLPDNLTTWTVRGVAHTEETLVGENTSELIAAKPLMIRPVAPRFFVVEDRAQLAANVTNNTGESLDVDVSLDASGLVMSESTPALQTVSIPANAEVKVTWWVTVQDVETAEMVFTAVSGSYTDASKPRLTTGPDGTLKVLRYTSPDIVGTAGQLIEGESQTEAIALPPKFDDRQGGLTVKLEPSLAAAMQDGLSYLEHYEYECTEQTVSRFLPNLLTYDALQSLGIEDEDLTERLPALLDEGLAKLYRQQNPDGGWGWWYRIENPKSNPYVSGYVVFALLKAQQAGVAVKDQVLRNGLAYLETQIQSVDEFANYRSANQQAWLLYVLAEGNRAPTGRLDDLVDNREKLSTYARAYLAQALWLRNPGDGRIETLLSDLNNAAILSATGAHWEESHYDYWAMNTDTRSTAIVLDTLAKLDPENALIPNVVRWLMIARKTGIWETTQETAWALIALTDWMVETGELDADFDYALYLNDEERAQGTARRETIKQGTETHIPIDELKAEMLNALTIARTEGPGRLYYTAHLEVYQPVEEIAAADRGFTIQRRYTLASCEAKDRLECPEVREMQLGDVVRVDITLVTPHDRYYVVMEDPLPAGAEAIDTGLATTSLLEQDPTLRREDSYFWWWWHWYSHSELRDEKVVLFADYLRAGTYEYSYTFRATLPGDYHVIPTVAKEFYFPEVFGRSEGRLLTIGQ